MVIPKGLCKSCVEAQADYGRKPGDKYFQPGFIPAGPLAPLTGFSCDECHGTGQAPWWEVYGGKV